MTALRWDRWDLPECPADPHDDADLEPDPPRGRPNTTPIPNPCPTCMGLHEHFPERHTGGAA